MLRQTTYYQELTEYENYDDGGSLVCVNTAVLFPLQYSKSRMCTLSSWSRTNSKVQLQFLAATVTVGKAVLKKAVCAPMIAMSVRSFTKIVLHWTSRICWCLPSMASAQNFLCKCLVGKKTRPNLRWIGTKSLFSYISQYLETSWSNKHRGRSALLN